MRKEESCSGIKDGNGRTKCERSGRSILKICIIIIIWGVSRSRQQSRRYIAAEDKAALKIRHKA